LRRLLFVAVILRKKVRGRADVAMPQHTLDRLRIDLPLVHEPGAQAVPQVVKTEALPFGKHARGAYCRLPKMVLHERRRPDGHLSILEQRDGKTKSLTFEYGLCVHHSFRYCASTGSVGT